jgi:tRNA-uridine 2-sulfurtransferase
MNPNHLQVHQLNLDSIVELPPRNVKRRKGRARLISEKGGFLCQIRYNKNDMHSLNEHRLNKDGWNPDLRSDHVVVGLSGGVDSAVTAALLKAEGYTVHGVFLNLWQLGEAEATAGDAPAASARRVAEALKLDLTVRDLRDRFYDTVVAPFMDAYSRGLTPNPCIMCNPTFKFQVLIETADDLQNAWIATGHYARVVREPGNAARLFTGTAASKDQSYALYRLRQSQLRRLHLPLGKLATKARVRELARRYQIPNAGRADSQDLCFVGGGDYREALRAERPEAFRPGPIFNEAGERLGEHSGLPGYTVGQRSGLGIASTERLYVLRLDPTRNALVVGPRAELARTACRIDGVTFIAGDPPAARFPATGRIRYRAPLSPLTVEMLNDRQARVTFDNPQHGVAPGQSLVFYRDDEVLGGGMIVEADSQSETNTLTTGV